MNRPDELKALLRLRVNGNAYAPPKDALSELAYSLDDDDKAFCYAALGKVSRSFSAVIRQLPEDLRDTVCLFYLALRALDTIEDDMSIPKDRKLRLLREFHTMSKSEDFRLFGVGDHDDYKVLLDHYPRVAKSMAGLKNGYEAIIDDISKRMGEGMAIFVERDIVTKDDFDEYCHYVAGLVGIGLSRMFLSSNPNALQLEHVDKVSNSMGLFLQKTNIIRDFREDLDAGRTFWPKGIWGQYCDQLTDFLKPGNRTESLACLNHLIADAVEHVPDCLTYMRSIRDEQIFRFAAVPQVMAIATLAKLFHNPKVFSKSVKVRKGLAARLLMYPISMEQVERYFAQYIRGMEKKMRKDFPGYSRTIAAIRQAKAELAISNSI